MFRCLLFLLLALPLRAESLSAPRAAELRERFQKRQAQTRFWSASFSQIIAMPGMREPVVSAGNLAFRAPDMLRMDFRKPEGEFVLVNGDRVFVQKRNKRVTEKSLTEDNAAKPFLSLLGLLRGQSLEEERWYTADVSRKADSYVIVLTRNDGASRRLPKVITNIVDAESLEVREVLVEVPNGGTIQYRFDSIVRNRPIETDVFAVPSDR